MENCWKWKTIIFIFIYILMFTTRRASSFAVNGIDDYKLAITQFSKWYALFVEWSQFDGGCCFCCFLYHERIHTHSENKLKIKSVSKPLKCVTSIKCAENREFDLYCQCSEEKKVAINDLTMNMTQFTLVNNLFILFLVLRIVWSVLLARKKTSYAHTVKMAISVW